MNLTAVKQKIADVDVVSFDIFDTLIVRLYRKPTDLFLHLEESTGVAGFAQARIDAERAVREEALANGVHEVTLSQIYNALHTSYQNLQQKEIELELFMCRANPEIKKVYDYCIANGKRVFISSDMYLPNDVIEKILHKNGYAGYQKLLLSSETLRPKATGEMYEELIRESGAEAQKILHIGDNIQTDYNIAQEHDLRVWHYSPIQETCGSQLNSAYFSCINHRSGKDIGLSMQEMLISLDEYENDRPYWERFGFKYVGIIAYGYVKWLKERFDAENIKKAYFMLRDGYILKRVFDKLYPDFSTEEMYGSRRMFLFAGAQNYDEIRFHLTGLHNCEMTYEQVWNCLGIEYEVLFRDFQEAFPDLNQTIKNEDDLACVDQFLEQHFDNIRSIGTQECELLEEYYQEILLCNEKAAIVDLGWKASILRGVEKTCKLAGKQADLTGFYFGTHECNTSGLRVESYLLDHGKSTGADNFEVLLDYGFVLQILELIFSAPHPSTLRLRKRNGDILPVYQEVSQREIARMEICQQILSGVMDYVTKVEEICRKYPFRISKEAALVPLEYLHSNASRKDQHELTKIHFFAGIDNDNNGLPILKTGLPVFAVVNPWPGDICAEYEVVERFKRAASEIGARMIVVDDFGRVCDTKQRATDEFLDPETVNFVITTHYESPKTIDAFYYHVLWNPPEIPLNLDYYVERVVNNYAMNDDFLTYDFGGMKNHLKGMLIDKPRDLENCSCLVASFPSSAMLNPKLENPVMFYCGMNWEKVTGNPKRHEGLFQLLDRTGKVKFYGPERVEAWGGIAPWEGYACYQHSIPFDGFSILKEINECGICLVLSSDIHRRAAAATNRLYEACAAGAVIISDDNEFVLRYFKDAALFITYNRDDPEDTFRQIMNQYEWIVTHPEEALKLVHRAQEIFRTKFSLDMQLKALINRHGERVEQIGNDLFAKGNSGTALVTFVLDTRDQSTITRKLDGVFRNVQHQNYSDIILAIAADEAVHDFVAAYCEMHCGSAKSVPMKLFDSKGVRAMTDGQAIRYLQKLFDHQYYVNTTEKETWFYDHLTTLVRTIQDHNTLCAYSGMMQEDCNQFRRNVCFSTLGCTEIYDDMPSNSLPAAGQFMFLAEADKYVPDFLFDCVDGKEHYVYLNLLHYKHKQKLAFSHRMTLVYYLDLMPNGNHVLDAARESRFIQALVKFDLPEAKATIQQIQPATTASAVGNRNIAQSMLILPLKNLIRLRYYKFWMFRLKPESKKYKKYEQKYSAVLSEYNRFWGI